VGTGDAGTVDVRERGANQQTSERRLFVQLQAFGGAGDPKLLVRAASRPCSTRTSTIRAASPCWA